MKFLLALLLSVTAPPADVPETFFVGDSIGHIMDEYGFLDYDHIDSVPGRPLEDGVRVLRGLDLHPGDTLVVELGTNNLDPATNYAPLIASLLHQVPSGVCVTWVAPAGFYVPVNGERFFAALTPLLAERECSHVVRWDLLGNATMTYDTVHPTYFGAWYLAALIEEGGQPLWV
jgi:hypothetical protein